MVCELVNNKTLKLFKVLLISVTWFTFSPILSTDQSQTNSTLKSLVEQHLWIKGSGASSSDEGSLVHTLGPRVLESTQSFINDPANRDLLSTADGQQLRQMQARLKNYFAIKSQFDRCVNKKGDKRNLNIRILNASFEAQTLNVPCNPIAKEFQSLDTFFRHVEDITKHQEPSVFQDALYNQSLRNSLTTLMDLRYTYEHNYLRKGKNNFYIKADIRNTVNKICPRSSCSDRTKELLKQHGEKEAARLMNSKEKIGFKQATEDVNEKIDRLNAKLDRINIVSDNGYVKLPFGIYDSSDPRYDNTTTQRQFNDYVNSYIQEASSGSGLLLLTDAIKEKSGGLRQFEDDDLHEHKRYGGHTTFEVKKHNRIKRRDIVDAKNEAQNKIIEQAARLNQMDKEKRTDEQDYIASGAQYDSYNPLTIDYVSMKPDREEDIAKLVKTNPAAVGEILSKSPRFAKIVCEAINNVSLEDESDEAWDEAFLWGGMIVGGALAITGIGAAAGAAIIAGASAATLGTVATVSFVAGTALGVGEGAYWSSRSYDHYTEMREFEGGFLTGNSDTQSIIEARESLSEFKQARFDAALAVGFSILDLGGLKAASTIIKKGGQAAARGASALSPKQLDVLSDLYRVISNKFISTKLANVVRLMGENGGKKLDEFLTLLATMPSDLRLKFLNKLRDSNMTPEKLKQIIEEALEAAKKNGSEGFEKSLKEGVENSDRRVGNREGSIDRRTANPEQRQMISQIDEELGEAKQIMLNRYNPDNVHQLSTRDQTYVAGLADDIEKELRRANPNMSPAEIKRKTQESLQEMIDACKNK
ncbi:MAG: hypothetical protein GY909_09515 [Oligoflexia bacterium]|nr:hypothetical protein [Oligoflexia bacterium]